MTELEKIIDHLSDAALLEMVDSDPALLALQATTLANASIEARGGRAALQSRLAGAIDLPETITSDLLAIPPTEADAAPMMDSPAPASLHAEPEPSVPTDGSVTATATIPPPATASDLLSAQGGEPAPTSQRPADPDAPAQPAPDDSSSTAFSDSISSSTPGTVEETVSAADIDAILAAACNASTEAITSVPVAATPAEISAAAATVNVLTEAECAVSRVPSATTTTSPTTDDPDKPPTEESATSVAEVAPPLSARSKSPHQPRRDSGRRFKPRQAVLAVIGMILLAVLGVLAAQRWFSNAAVPAHAREGKIARAVAALETCHILYESTAGATRPQLIHTIAPLGRGMDAAQSFDENLNELRRTQASRIAACQAAHHQAETEFATLTRLHDVPPALAADFEKLSLIMIRHHQFLGAGQPPQSFAQWYNDYERMTAIYTRIRKQLAQMETAAVDTDMEAK